MKPQGITPVGGIEPGLISMGAVGLHPLFRSEWIRRSFDRLESGELQPCHIEDVHQALKKLGRLRSMNSKRRFLDSLPEPTVDTLVFLYFRSLDQFLERTETTLH